MKNNCVGNCQALIDLTGNNFSKSKTLEDYRTWNWWICGTFTEKYNTTPELTEKLMATHQFVSMVVHWNKKTKKDFAAN